MLFTEKMYSGIRPSVGLEERKGCYETLVQTKTQGFPRCDHTAEKPAMCSLPIGYEWRRPLPGGISVVGV